MIGYGGFPATSRRDHGPAKLAPTRVRTGSVGSKDVHLCQGRVIVQNPGPRLQLFVAQLQFSSTLQPYQSFLSRTVPPNVATFSFERVFRSRGARTSTSFQIILAERWSSEGAKFSSDCINAATSTAKRSKVFALSPTDKAFATVPTPCRTEYCKDDGGRRTMESPGIIRCWRRMSLKVTSMSSQYSFERGSGRSRNEV